MTDEVIVLIVDRERSSEKAIETLESDLREELREEFSEDIKVSRFGLDTLAFSEFGGELPQFVNFAIDVVEIGMALEFLREKILTDNEEDTKVIQTGDGSVYIEEAEIVVEDNMYEYVSGKDWSKDTEQEE